MSIAKAIKNDPGAMDSFTPVEGLYVIQNSNTIEFIGNLAVGNYSGAGALVISGLIAGKQYEYTPGANDTSLTYTPAPAVNDPTIDTAGTNQKNTPANVVLAPASGVTVFFIPNTTSVTLAGTASAASTARLIQTKHFQKLWLYPYKAKPRGGAPTLNVATAYAGKSGSAATQFLPDALTTTAQTYPVVYEFPVGQKMHLGQVLIYGTAGDGVFYQYT